jgi:hypothetical protein
VLLNQVEQGVNPLRRVEVGIELLVSAIGFGEAGEDVSDALHPGMIPRLGARPKGLGAVGVCDGLALALRAAPKWLEQPNERGLGQRELQAKGLQGRSQRDVLSSGVDINLEFQSGLADLVLKGKSNEVGLAMTQRSCEFRSPKQADGAPSVFDVAEMGSGDTEALSKGSEAELIRKANS